MKVIRDDGVLRLLGALPAMPSDAERAARLRARCHQQLRTRTQRADLRRRALEAGVALFSAAYLSQLARMALVMSR